MSPDIAGEPQEVLYPPEILLWTTDDPPSALLDPPDDGTTRMIDRSCCSMEFKAKTIRDLNLRDKLYVRWFLDWDHQVDKPVGGPAWPNPQIISPTRDELRVGPVHPLSNFDIVALADDKVHTLKLFVADRPLYEYGNGTEGADEPDLMYDTYYWVFKVSVGTGICSSGKYTPCTD